ncbi:MAG: SDR family NAD(P)-dependent oxidoreductase [Eubacteriales bacterium]|nr:SDR family NAD(P)-dependent oxidoreductase [Eubacteriales bacterium]
MKNIIITGATSGLGLETAKKAAKASNEYRLILACRDMEKAECAKDEIVAYSGNSGVLPIQLDTASLDSVRAFAEQYRRGAYGKIYALLCNAGISGGHKGITKDGYDVIFETNHLGHFLLTRLLLPEMEEKGRIFATSSDMHDPFNTKLVWHGAEALAHPDAKLANSMDRYAYSKLCNLYFIYELNRRLQERGSEILANAFNPGLMKTNFMPLNKLALESVKHLMPKRFGDLEKSSDAYAALAAMPDLSVSGQYFDRSTHTCETSALSYNRENALELWTYSEMCTEKYMD